MRKCIHGRCPQYYKNYFVSYKDICACSTHQSNRLHLLALRTEMAKRSFYYHGSMAFNNYCKCTLLWEILLLVHMLNYHCIYFIVFFYGPFSEYRAPIDTRDAL